MPGIFYFNHRPRGDGGFVERRIGQRDVLYDKIYKMRRALKQIIYGVLFLTILIGFFAMLLGSLGPSATCFDGIQNQGENGVDCGGPCISCELKGLEIVVNKVRFFPAGNYQVNVIAEATNPSINYAARFHYNLYIANRFGLRMRVVDGTTVILPSETKYLVVPAIDVNYRDIGAAKLVVREIEWKRQEDLQLPEITVEDVKVAVDERYVEVTGTVHHQGSGTIRRLLVAALFFEAGGELIQFSTTRLDNIASFSSRDFKIILPRQNLGDKTLNPRLTKVVVEIMP